MVEALQVPTLETMTDKITSVVVVMRHGERIDKTIIERFKNTDWDYSDPILTPEGKQ